MRKWMVLLILVLVVPLVVMAGQNDNKVSNGSLAETSSPPITVFQGDSLTLEELSDKMNALTDEITNAPASTEIDIELLLTRCLEFLRDGDVDQNMVQGSMALIYCPRTLKSEALGAVEEARKEMDRVEKETQLRRDIERALAVMRGAYGTIPAKN